MTVLMTECAIERDKLLLYVNSKNKIKSDSLFHYFQIIIKLISIIDTFVILSSMSEYFIITEQNIQNPENIA